MFSHNTDVAMAGLGGAKNYFALPPKKSLVTSKFLLHFNWRQNNSIGLIIIKRH